MLYTQGKTDCKPSEVNYDESRLEILNKHFQKMIDADEIFCASYCIARKGKIFAHGAVGSNTYKKDEKTPLKPDAINFIASITKIFTALAIGKLVDDGITRFDVTVGSILPQFNAPPFNGITLQHLLTHTSGMHADGGCFPNEHNRSGYWYFIEKAYKSHNPKDGEFDWLSAALSHGVRFEPDKEWMYCSFGFVILGVIIEKLTGVKAEKYIEDNIAKPLGMKDTTFNLNAKLAKRSIVFDKHSEKKINALISGKKEKKTAEDLFWETLPETGGGLYSTPQDLIRFANMTLCGGTLDGTRVIGRKTLEKMTSINAALPNHCWGSNEPKRYYGLGFDMRGGGAFTHSEGTFMHEGWGYCSVYMDKKEDLAAAWFVPYAHPENWYPHALYNVQNIIWSGLK